ncbi:hypothetical protein [Paenibacillus terrae]|uniref:hypothetical protein n=1 Tax=Paenibacillus terrae TaxID=159743 RepID=UPI0011EAA67A|nr:hypothetical protein [Paenibacillus terrae]
MRKIIERAYTDLGRELKEAQDKLADHYGGVFVKWLDYMGYPRRTAYELISRYNELLRIPQNLRDAFEALPISLSKHISAPSAESTEPKRQAKAAILNGEVRTLKDYRALVQKLEEAEARAEKAEGDYETVRDTLDAIAEHPDKTEYVPDPDMSDRLKRYEAKFGDIDGMATEMITNHTEVDGAAAHFADDVQTLLLNYAHLTVYRANFVNISEASRGEYESTLAALGDFVKGMRKVLDDVNEREPVVFEM